MAFHARASSLGCTVGQARRLCGPGAGQIGMRQCRSLLRHLQAMPGWLKSGCERQEHASNLHHRQARQSCAAGRASAPNLPAPPTATATEYRLLSPNYKPVVGASKQMARLSQQIQQFARNGEGGPVLITGEAGLHKLCIAARIHAQSHVEDPNKPLVVIDCSSSGGQRLAEQLLQGCADMPMAAAAAEAVGDEGLAAALERGTVVFENMHLAPQPLTLLAAEVAKADAAAGYAAALTANLASVDPLGSLGSHCPPPDLRGRPERTISSTTSSTSSLDEGGSSCSKWRCSATRVVFTAGQEVPLLGTVPTIKVPPLRSRSSDIKPLAEQYALDAALLRGYKGVALAPAAVRQLLSYPFPGNEEELHALAARAVMLHPPAPAAAASSGGCCKSTGNKGSAAAAEGECGCGGKGPQAAAAAVGSDAGPAKQGCCGSGGSRGQGQLLELELADFWPATAESDRWRLDVFESWPWLKQALLGSRVWPEGVQSLVKWCFPLVIALLFIGPQDRAHNGMLTVFWAGWWPLVLLSYPFLGRSWCAICPFMVYGEAAQNIVDAEQHPAAAKPAATAEAEAAEAVQLAAGPRHSPVVAAASLGAAERNAAGTTTTTSGSSSSEGSFAGALGLVAAAFSGWFEEADSGGAVWQWKLRKWPTEPLAKWGGWALLAGFAGILLWEEVWDLKNTADLSGWLLLLITGGATACSLVYERRLWCRYLCPIGGMNGLFAKLSMIEIRSRPGICASGTCGKFCYKGRSMDLDISDMYGSDLPLLSNASMSSCSSSMWESSWSSSDTSGDDGTHAVRGSAAAAAAAAAAAQGSSLPGCPMNSHPGRHVDNHDCIMCGNCLRSCPNGSAQLRLRPPGSDLLGGHGASWEELNLMFLLLGAVLLHELPHLAQQLHLPPELLQDKAPHLLTSLAVLAAPAGLCWLAYKAVSVLAPPDTTAADAPAPATFAGGQQQQQQEKEKEEQGLPSFLQFGYAYLPLVWAGSLAYYEDMLLTELGQLLPRSAAALYAPTPLLELLPALAPTSPDVVAAAQGVTLLAGTALSWLLTQQLARGADQRQLLGSRLVVLGVAAELWYLLVGTA